VKKIKYLILLMNDIYNFIKINDDEIISIYITELNQYIKNKHLQSLGNRFYNYLLKNKLIKKDTIVILSFIKHFSKSIKNMIISKNEDLNLQINSNKIISDYILNYKSNSIFDNFLIINSKEELVIHKIKKKFSIKEHLFYFL
jgi:hypothetical protein